MKSKRDARLRRGLRVKAMIKRNADRPRLVVFRSSLHIYAQIVSPAEKGDVVLVAASSMEKEVRTALQGSKVERAKQIGEILGKRAKEKNISKVAFDRSGYRYHGRVEALANGAREAGLNF